MPKDTSSRYVVAVSGGVDSVVLLDAIVTGRAIAGVQTWQSIRAEDIIVAHVDHGIRDDSREDEAFVRQLAERYGCKYRSKRVELGPTASEENARRHRYDFLREVCREFDAMLVTAHHCNDIAETIAINVTRGTGWRGLAVLDTESIWRPLLGVTKRELLQYASTHSIAWHEDSTNATPTYLRNRIRTKINSPELLWQLASLRTAQVEIKKMIDAESRRLIESAPYSRYFMAHCGDDVAIELLRELFMQETGASPTRPARSRALHAIKVARHGSVIHIADGTQIRLTRTHFVVEQTDKVLS